MLERVMLAMVGSRGRQIADYVRSGFEVDGVVGVADSPSCGVMRTLDLHGALDALADAPLAALTTHLMNARVVAANAVRGQAAVRLVQLSTADSSQAGGLR